MVLKDNILVLATDLLIRGLRIFVTLPNDKTLLEINLSRVLEHSYRKGVTLLPKLQGAAIQVIFHAEIISEQWKENKQGNNSNGHEDVCWGLH